MKFKKRESKQVPRKLKKQIPEGLYCYTGIRFDLYTGIYHTKECVFYDRIKAKDLPKHKLVDYEKEDLEDIVHWCKLVKCELLDQCKSWVRFHTTTLKG